MRDRLRSNEKAVYRMINAALLTSIALFGTVGFLGTGGRVHLFAALAAVALLAGMNFMAARGRLLCGAVLLGLLFAGLTIAGWAESLAFLRSFLPWLLGGRMPDGMTITNISSDVPPGIAGTGVVSPGTIPEAWAFGYGMMQSAMIGAVCYAAEILLEKIPLLKRMFAAVLLILLFISMLFRWEPDHFAVVFLMAYLALVCVEWIQSRWEKVRGERGSSQAHTLWIMPFLLLYLGLMAIMPVPEEPYDWMWAKRICDRIGDTFMTMTQNLKWGDREGFGVAFSGFSEEGDLAGNLRQEADQVMTVWVYPGLRQYRPENLYLTGNVLDTFDGRGWSKKRQEAAGESFLDTAQTLQAVRRANREYQRDYLKEISLDIRYEDFSTGFLFAPLKTWELEGWDERPLEDVVPGEELRWRGQKGFGTQYRVQYLAMNLGRQEFDLFIERTSGQAREQAAGQTREQVPGRTMEQVPGRTMEQTAGQAWGQVPARTSEQMEKEAADEAVWAGVLQECRQKNGYKFTIEDIKAYREAVYRDYLKAVELSPEAERCLQEMTEGAGTQMEKLRAIERGLAAFSYTRTPGELPKGVTGEAEFLDYFLLESRQGYCTYFATAFVLLARAEGIPARYVQGYCVPVQEGETVVRSNMAHAWPEAYLEGVGWIPFEPTPGYGGLRYASWEMEQPGDGADGAPGGELELPGQGVGIGEGLSGLFGEAERAGDESLEEPEAEDATQGWGRWGFWRLPGFAALAALLACGAFWMLDGILYRYRYQKMEPEEKFRTEVFRNLEILRWFGLERKPWETLQEAGERAGELPGLESAVPLVFLKNYERVIYGGKPAGEDMIGEAIRERERLLRLLESRKRWAYLYCCLKLHLPIIQRSLR